MRKSYHFDGRERKRACETETATHSAYRPSTGGAIWRLSRRLQASGQALPVAIALARSVCRCRSHDAKSYVEIMEIGFVSLLGDNRFLHVTLFYVTTSICGILALFGHFFTFKSPPVKRRGFQTCGPCRVGRLSLLARHPNCERVG
jgi:hypothetical protein